MLRSAKILRRPSPTEMRVGDSALLDEERCRPHGDDDAEILGERGDAHRGGALLDREPQRGKPGDGVQEKRLGDRQADGSGDDQRVAIAVEATQEAEHSDEHCPASGAQAQPVGIDRP
jgi:hypothetical protein